MPNHYFELYPPKLREDAQDSFLAHFLGDWSQHEKLFEIKLPYSWLKISRTMSLDRKKKRENTRSAQRLSLSSSDLIIPDIMLEIALESKVGHNSAKICLLTNS